MESGEPDTEPQSAAAAAAGGAPEYDEREDLFGFDEFVVEHAGAGSHDDFNLDELIDAIAVIPETEAQPQTGERPAELAAPTAGRADGEILAQILAAQQRLLGPDPGQVGGGARSLGRRARSALSVVVIAAVIVLTLINAGVVGYSFIASRNIQDEMLRHAGEVIAVTEQIRDETSRQVRDLEALQGPVMSQDPEYSRAFDELRELMDAGEHGEARGRLYSLLAVLDRLEPGVREDAEARACFLLGDTLRLEALARKAAEDAR